MRPRRMRLGYLSDEVLRLFQGDGFNEAEAHAPRIQELMKFLEELLTQLQ